jgi:large conductance mechanosensitive channel
MFKEFKKFVLRGNLVDLAVGFTVGAAFSGLAKSLVNDILMPPIALILGKTDFSNLFFVLKGGEKPGPYESIQAAQQSGAVTINYGAFINNLLSLLIVALAMFLVIRAFNHLEDQIVVIGGRKSKGTPTNKKCPYCYSSIAYKATRCPACTSRLEKVEK